MGQLPSDATESKKVEKNWEGRRVQQRKENKLLPAWLTPACRRVRPQGGAHLEGQLPASRLGASQTSRSSLVQRVGHGTRKGTVAGWMPCGPLHVTFFLFLFYLPHDLESAAFHPNTDTIY